MLRSWASYKPVPVFNVCDLEGEALAGLIKARLSEARMHQAPAPREIMPIVAAEQKLGAWPVSVSWGGEKALYSPAADRISLPERSAFHSSEALYATWTHEAIHSTGHSSRLARDLSESFGSPAYAREELMAELGSVLIGQRLAIGCELTNHAAYLESWIAVLRQSPQVLLQVLSAARKAADLIAPEVALAEVPPKPL